MLNKQLLFALVYARATGTPQWQIARKSDVNPTMLSLWAHGHRTPSRDQALRVASALGVDIDYLWPDLQAGSDPAVSIHKEQRPGWQSEALQKSIPASKPESAEATGAVGHAEV